jgi:hypothetical protein
MKALTIWQPWASLIILGHKRVEWRGWPPPQRLVGRRLVIHAAARPCRREVRMLLAIDLVDLAASLGGVSPGRALRARAELEAVAGRGHAMPFGCGLGTAVVGHAFSPASLGENWGWPLRDVELWREPVPAVGKQGLWDWPEPPAATP